MIRVVIVGAGLSGLTAAAFAASEGAQATLVAFGEGGLSLSHGGIELWASSSPSRSIKRLPKNHPYQLAGPTALRAGISRFRKLVEENGLTYEGGISSNHGLLTASGQIRPAALIPAGAAVSGDLQKSPAAIAVLPGLRDYFPDLIVRWAADAGIKLRPAIELPLIDVPEHRGVYAVDLARLFDDLSWRQEILRAWKPKLTGVRRLILPACLGLRNSRTNRTEVEDELGLRLFEIALLPPSVPGLRLQVAMHRALQAYNVDVIEGAMAIGRFDGSSSGKRTAGLVIETAGASHSLDADAVILATGGVLHGGILAPQTPEFREAVFQIPIEHPQQREQRVSFSPFMAQPYQLAGVRVNAAMQPLGPDGKPFLENLFAAGGILAGTDRTGEGSRQGIDIATAYQAVQSALRLPGKRRQASSGKRAK
jgi:glycerol-3-phosphate dehydrogenase subunit B